MEKLRKDQSADKEQKKLHDLVLNQKQDPILKQRYEETLVQLKQENRGKELAHLPNEQEQEVINEKEVIERDDIIPRLEKDEENRYGEVYRVNLSTTFVNNNSNTDNGR